MGEALLFYLLPVHERLDWQVCLQWLINSLAIVHMMLPKIKIESCHTHPVDHGTRLLITKDILLTNCCQETIYHIYVSSMSLTHWYQYCQILPQWMWWQLTCISLCCLLAIWSMTHLVFIWWYWSVTYLLMILLQAFIIPHEGHLPSCPPIAI